ncbi:hypothetical protein WAE56_17985 [Iodobacter sp. LRB]|uniref:hypothetical protein n=1 Tax=Iodobacter sp. LRB TaxID=3127955 RepID=UPI00307FBBE9
MKTPKSKIIAIHPVSPANSILGSRPLPNFVVSQYADGAVASHYADLAWDWTPYTRSGKQQMLNFQFWPKERGPTEEEELLLDDMHWLAYLLVWRRSGPTLSYPALSKYISLFRVLAQFCFRRQLTLTQLLKQEELVLEVHHHISPLSSKALASLIRILAVLGPSEVGFDTVGMHTWMVLRGHAIAYANSCQQHPPLPTQVYSNIMAKLVAELTAFEQISDSYFHLVMRCSTNPFLGYPKDTQRRIAQRLSIKLKQYEDDFHRLIAEYGLRDYLESKSLISEQKQLGRSILSAGLTRIQTVCRLVIQLFSGMRDGETAELPYDCLESKGKGGKLHYFLVGTTSKLNNGKAKTTKWVTSSEGARAVALAQRIALLCHKKTNTTPNEASTARLPLFPSPSYLGLSAVRLAKSHDGRLVSSRLRLDYFSDLRNELQPIITEADLRELERIDPHRAWRSEPKFQVGQPWTLTTHQLRRSLALYAQRSGLVSLPSLRRQLQHLTEAMSRYYAKGSAFADNLIAGDKNHFGTEWRETQSVSSALSYIFNVLTTDEVLFGPHGDWIHHRLKGDDGNIILDREETIKRFNKGELAYKETILGGCVSTEPCDIQPIKWLNVDCVNGCKNMVGSASKLDRVIAAQTKLVERLSPGSFEYRTEHADLQVLLDVRQRIHDRLSK